MHKFYLFLIYFYFIPIVGLYAQKNEPENKLTFEGLVYGYEYDPTYKIFKNKPTLIEGLLEQVQINVYDNIKLRETITSDHKGFFSIRLGFNNFYKIELIKKGYNATVFYVNTYAVPKNKMEAGMLFSGQLIMNSFIEKDEIINDNVIGTLYYDINGEFWNFKVNEKRLRKKTFLSKEKMMFDNAVELMQKAVLKNKENSLVVPAVANEIKLIPQKVIKNPIEDAVKILKNKNDSLLALNKRTINSPFKLKLGLDNESINEEALEFRKDEISEARSQLELDRQMVQTREDSLLINQRESVIKAAELEIANAYKLINLQNVEINSQKKLSILYMAMIGLFIVVFGITFFYYFEKKRSNKILDYKNKKIVDSIMYARRIQTSVLLPEAEIQKSLPDFFVFYQPKDIVSGDFYWFTKVKNKFVVAVVDCTGHGVPGAFMSLIGNMLLNEIVNEKKTIDPAEILEQLHYSLVKCLRQEYGDDDFQDGMEMSLCVIDPQKNIVEYSGAMNPIYLVENGTLKVVNGNIKSIGGKSLRPEKNVQFTKETLMLSKNDMVYMFTDGYMDQFGGPENTKFNTKRFKQLLVDIEKESMPEQKQKIIATFEQWKGEHAQIDDVLVVGIRL